MEGVEEFCNNIWNSGPAIPVPTLLDFPIMSPQILFFCIH